MTDSDPQFDELFARCQRGDWPSEEEWETWEAGLPTLGFWSGWWHRATHRDWPGAVQSLPFRKRLVIRGMGVIMWPLEWFCDLVEKPGKRDR